MPPTYAEITEALRSDPEFQGTTNAFLMVCLVLAHGRRAADRGESFGEWLDHIEALLQEPLS